VDARPVALVVNPQPEIGIGEPVGIWLDLDRGTCREAKVVSQSEADQAAFVISGDYQHWKRVIRKELGPIAGIMQRKLMLKGSLPIVVRFVKSPSSWSRRRRRCRRGSWTNESERGAGSGTGRCLGGYGSPLPAP